MFRSICLTVAIAMTAAQKLQTPYSVDHYATDLRRVAVDNANGNFQYGYETSNQIQADATGFIKNPQYLPNEAIQAIHGSYSYYTPDGAFVSVTYTADEKGYKPRTQVIRPGGTGYSIRPVAPVKTFIGSPANVRPVAAPFPRSK